MVEPKRILFPVDFSPSCQHIASTVGAWAQRFEADVTLLHAFEFPADYAEGNEQEAARAREALHRKLHSFASQSLPGLPTKLVLLQGKPAAMIVLHAHEHESGIIMMPTRGQSGFRALLMGSTVLGVLHDSECPVWTTAHADDPAMPSECRRIVCAVDMQKHTVRTLRWANSLKQRFGAELHIVHAVPAIDPRFDSAAAERAHSLLVWTANQDYPALAKEAGVTEPLEVVQTPGLSASITAAVASLQADLLVIGRGTVQGFLGRLRTNAHELIRMSPCPVLSV